MEDKGEIFISEKIQKDKEKKKEPLMHYKEVVSGFSGRLSWHRLRRLLNTGKVKGEKRYRKGKRGYPWVWHTNQEAVARYLKSKKSASEYGKLGGRPRKQGIAKKGVVFQS